MNPSESIDEMIAGLTDWRGASATKLRKLINAAAPGLKEEFKWGSAVWTQNGNVCALGAFKTHLKINFFKGASLPDPHGLFNAGLDAKLTRTIDIHQGDNVNEPALKELIRAAIALHAK